MSNWNPFERNVKPARVVVNGVALKEGDRVLLRPNKTADIMDLALAGQTAIIQSIEQDYEDKIHLALIIEDDPGRDLGVFGHRFFFSPDEVIPLDGEQSGEPSK